MPCAARLLRFIFDTRTEKQAKAEAEAPAAARGVTGFVRAAPRHLESALYHLCLSPTHAKSRMLVY